MTQLMLRLPYEDVQKLEPSIIGHDADPKAEHDLSELHIQFSAAVSLRRIADFLEGGLSTDTIQNSYDEA